MIGLTDLIHSSPAPHLKKKKKYIYIYKYIYIERGGGREAQISFLVTKMKKAKQ
jgi:hypothetical protein